MRIIKTVFEVPGSEPEVRDFDLLDFVKNEETIRFGTYTLRRLPDMDILNLSFSMGYGDDGCFQSRGYRFRLKKWSMRN